MKATEGKSYLVGLRLLHYAVPVSGKSALFVHHSFVEFINILSLFFQDPTFASNWKGIKASGIPIRGAYHFGHPGDSAQTQVCLLYLISSVS